MISFLSEWWRQVQQGPLAQCLQDQGILGCIESKIAAIDVREDTVQSLCFGAVLGLVLLLLLAKYPGQPIDYGTMADGSQVPEQLRFEPTEQPQRPESAGEGSSMDPTSTLRRRRSKGTSDGEDATAPSNGQNADAVAQNIRASKLSKMLGLSEEQVQEAIREAQKEAEQGVNYAPPRSKQGVSLTLGADVIFYSCLIGAFLYYLQHDSEGGATRFLTSLFPREMAVFGYGRQDGR